MNPSHMLLTVLAIVVTLRGDAFGYGADETDHHWKFIVPVSLDSMLPEATSATIQVIVKDANDNTVGIDETGIDIPDDGVFKEQVIVYAKANEGRSPHDGETYEVNLMLGGQDGRHGADNSGAPEYAKSLPGSGSVTQLSGDLP